MEPRQVCWGDIWEVGGHRVMCGVARHAGDVDLLTAVDPAKAAELPRGTHWKAARLTTVERLAPWNVSELAKHAGPGAVVLDLDGRVSTLFAAQESGWRALLMHPDPQGVEVLFRHYEHETGQCARRIVAGETSADCADYTDRSGNPWH